MLSKIVGKLVKLECHREIYGIFHCSGNEVTIVAQARARYNSNNVIDFFPMDFFYDCLRSANSISRKRKYLEMKK